LIYIASPDARQSTFVKDELGYAKQYHKPIIPLLVSGNTNYDALPQLVSLLTQNVPLPAPVISSSNYPEIPIPVLYA
jgi:hypothetical protein